MLRKVMFVTAVLFAVTVGVASSQTVIDMSDFSSLEGWTRAAGDWRVDGNRLHQGSTTALMARIDRAVPHDGVFELRFNARYEDGGYRTLEELRNQILHAGFGVHIGLRNPLLGVESWGAGESYLLWLNLDTRNRTAQEYPEHFGLRAQVYESRSPVNMDLLSAPWVRRELRQPRLSIDLPAVLEAAGIRLTIADVEPYLGQIVPIRIRVNTNTGVVSVADPTAPLWYRIPLDAGVLSRGEYISLRTNSLAASFGNFRVVEQ